MFERVRESLAELLTPEEAKALVERAIEESLFKPKYKKGEFYNSPSIEVPNGFQVLVKEAVEPLIKSAIEQWIAEHHEEVTASIQGVVEQGIAGTVVKVFQEQMRHPMYEMGGKLQKVIMKLGGV